MRSSYAKQDVILLLKDVTGKIQPLDTAEREAAIQSGVHYSEMLPVEYRPSPEYLELYREALKIHGKKTAQAVMTAARKVWRRKGKDVVLVSLARAGTPVGVLMKRYLQASYGVEVPHYTISIIRGRGIDKNAMAYLLAKYPPESLQFVDGWIGKGAIIGELRQAVKAYPGVDSELAVLADPARLTPLFGTDEDFLIPSACLNATVSGLFSRTILNERLLGAEDFHGAVYYEELESEDLTYDFIHAIEKYFSLDLPDCQVQERSLILPLEEIAAIEKKYGVRDRNLIKPGVGEATRVLLRRLPWKILVRDKRDTTYIGHILRLAEEKHVPVEEYPLVNYRACGIIQDLHGDL